MQLASSLLRNICIKVFLNASIRALEKEGHFHLPIELLSECSLQVAFLEIAVLEEIDPLGLALVLDGEIAGGSLAKMAPEGAGF